MASNSHRYDNDLLQEGYVGGKEVFGESNKRYNLGVGYRFNRPFGSVAPIKDYDYVVQRNKGGERVGLFAEDIHNRNKISPTNLGSRIRKNSTGHLKDL